MMDLWMVLNISNFSCYDGEERCCFGRLGVWVFESWEVVINKM